MEFPECKILAVHSHLSAMLSFSKCDMSKYLNLKLRTICLVLLNMKHRKAQPFKVPIIEMLKAVTS